jgi:hypothetical protein
VSYVDPGTVVSPKNRVKSVDVLYNAGRWSAALLDYDGAERLGIRWNGSKKRQGVGNPQSHGRPTWFVVPEELAAVVRERVEQLADSQEGGLLAGYREMANDQEQEVEALEWCEGLVGDAINEER